jgi:hypothetical protein
MGLVRISVVQQGWRRHCQRNLAILVRVSLTSTCRAVCLSCGALLSCLILHPASQSWRDQDILRGWYKESQYQLNSSTCIHMCETFATCSRLNRLTPAGSCIDDRAAVCTLTQPMERRIGVWVRGVRLSLGTKPNAYHVARLNSAKILSSQQLKCIHAYEVLTIRSMQEDPSSVTHASPYVGTSVEHHHQILFSRGANNITQTQSRTDIGIDNRTCRDTWGEPHKLTPTS